MSFEPTESDYTGIVNIDLKHKFEVQPMNRKQLPYGDLLQIAVPNQASSEQFNLLIQAFMRASRLPFPPRDSYWAGNVIYGAGRGTHSLVKGVLTGVGGVVYEPYKGARARGMRGGVIGVFKGLGGLIHRPLKGGFDFVA